MTNSRRRRPQPGPARPRPPEPADATQARASGGEATTSSVHPQVHASRMGAGSGVIFALLSFVGSALLGAGDVEPADPAADIAARFVDQRGSVSLGIFLTLVSLFFLLVFVAYLHRWLRMVEGEDGWYATLALAGGVLLVGALLLGVLVAVSTTVLEDYGADPVIARTLLVLGWQGVALAFVPASAFVGSVSLVGVRSGALPRWLCTSGLVLACGLLVIPVAFIPFLFSTLWTGLVAVTLLTRAGPVFRRRN